MSCQSKQGIVPQLPGSVVWPVRSLSMVVLSTVCLALSACSTVQLKTPVPNPPATLQEARNYVDNRERVLEFLEYEMNVESRACYERFFVSSCLDEVRMQGAQLRRAHLEVQGKAEDMIRLEDYANRRARDSK